MQSSWMYIESLTYDIPPHQLSWFLSTFLLPRSIHFRRTSSLIFFFFVFFHIYESIYCDATLLLCGSGWRKTNKIKTAGCILKHSMVTSKDCYRDCLSDKQWLCIHPKRHWHSAHKHKLFCILFNSYFYSQPFHSYSIWKAYLLLSFPSKLLSSTTFDVSWI